MWKPLTKITPWVRSRNSPLRWLLCRLLDHEYQHYGSQGSEYYTECARCGKRL